MFGGAVVLALGVGSDVLAQPSETAAPTLIEAPQVALSPGVEPPRADRRAVVELTIDRRGRVVMASIVSGVRPDIDVDLLEAARRARFSPGMRAGRPVPARIRFELAVSGTERDSPPNEEHTEPRRIHPHSQLTDPRRSPPSGSPRSSIATSRRGRPR